MAGLIIGRFQPFHLGHLDIIRRIILECGSAKVAIGSAQYEDKPENPFSADERERMIRAALEDDLDFEIFRVADIHDPPHWVAHVRDIVGDFDVVYSDNETTLRLFKEADCRVVEHTKFQGINARDIRALMLKEDVDYLDMIPGVVAEILVDINAIGRLRKMAAREHR